MVDSQSVKSTGVGGEQRGYDDGGKKVKGRKRHLLVDTPRVWCSKPLGSQRESDGLRGDQDPPRRSRRNVRAPLSSVAGRWLPRGEDKGKDWVEKTLGWSVDPVQRPRKPAPQEVLMAWAREWAKESVALDWERFMPPRGLQVLPRRWVVERTFAWIDQNRRMSKDYERLPESGEAFIYVAMSHLMARRLARL